ncbi:hypothetical protein K505DRAFT_247767 [Melanomma pulvis-pyrius CBS 109.77]|uniref:Uncharacterized protein n=1 Tax=Melanomma pulvis-pyrius CBS 109.77 TaxID=1314802 RepID=A0A6A6X6Q7_9PLEO|nr:hypothetical protein K505DRAFT_247767 [Melanomma pulvis-pyrius CBS 109.77]
MDSEDDLTDSDVDVVPTRGVAKRATRPTKKAKTVAGVYEEQLFLVNPVMKRMKRIVDPSNPRDAGLIRQATKAGPEYYDSEADDLPGEVQSVKHPEWYRNVKWGPIASDYTHFQQSEPHVQFVPGRWEHQPDGTVRDQKHKLLVKFVDNNGKQKIFTNPPPKDWNHQEALTALNKRIAQQWRRSTNYRFRPVVCAYVREERVWISKNLNDEGKPTDGWKSFVDAFNAAFHNKMLSGQDDPRPLRSQSSLTKEIERFSAVYKAGRIPVPARNQENRAAGKAKRQAKKA